MERMTRAQFVAATGALGEDRLRQLLWTVYWRGPAVVRSRIETELSPSSAVSQRAAPRVDPVEVLAEVTAFVSLVRSGAYFAGDRRVSPKQRTRWRFVFKELVGSARQALLSDPSDAADDARHDATGDVTAQPGAAAMAMLIDLACELHDYDHVRSQDPVAAAGLVVSDEVAVLWGRMLARRGVHEFARDAMVQLLRWESPYGWTRRGEGPVARRETTLAHVLEGLLVVPDAWEVVAEHYLAALEAAPATRGRRERARVMAGWHEILRHRLAGAAAEPLLDRIVQHRALTGG